MWLTAAALCAGCVSAVNALTGVNVYGECFTLPLLEVRICTERLASHVDENSCADAMHNQLQESDPRYVA